MKHRHLKSINHLEIKPAIKISFNSTQTRSISPKTLTHLEVSVLFSSEHLASHHQRAETLLCQVDALLLQPVIVLYHRSHHSIGTFHVQHHLTC